MGVLGGLFHMHPLARLSPFSLNYHQKEAFPLLPPLFLALFGVVIVADFLYLVMVQPGNVFPPNRVFKLPIQMISYKGSDSSWTSLPH